jgi:site-specific DNA recombinase
LVKEIILSLEESELQVDVRGDLAAILVISLGSKTPAGRSQFEMVAGTTTE